LSRASCIGFSRVLPAMLKAEAVIFSLERPALFEIGLKAKK